MAPLPWRQRSTAPGLFGLRSLLGGIWLAAFLVSIDYTALNVALPTLSADFGVGTSDVSWIALAYMLVMVALTMVTGPVIDRLGYRRALTGALGLFAASSLISALGPAFWLLVALRGVQGMGASVMFVIGPALIKTWFPPETHDRAFAIFSTGPMAGLCAGPAIGGELTAAFGWPSVFLFNVPFALLALLLLLRSQARAPTRAPTGTPATPQPATTPDPLSALAAVSGLLMVVLALNQGQEWGWSSEGIVALFVAAALSVLGFVIRERRAQSPLINRAIFRSRDFAATALVFLLVLVVFGGSVFLLPFYFQWLWKLGMDSVGHILMVQPIATIAVSNLAVVFFAGTPRRTLCLAGIPVLVAGVTLLALTERSTPLLVPISALLLMGAGIGLYYPALLQIGMASVPARLAASASSLQAAIRVLAQLLGVVLFETVFSQRYPSALDASRAAAASGDALDLMQSAFHTVFWCGVGIATLALVPALALTKAFRPVSDAVETTETEGMR